MSNLVPALDWPAPPLAAFGAADWAVLGLYLLVMLGIGVGAMLRERKEATEEFFLGGRSMPSWALAISIVGSSLSAATFIGAPDRAYSGNLTYLILNLGGFMAVGVVGFFFVPRLYRAGTVTIYGFLAQRYGEPARMAVSATFLLGRLLASGSRLMLAAFPLCLLIFGLQRPTFGQMAIAIAIIGFVGTFYTCFGGIRTVVWVDTIQFALVVGAVVLSIAILLNKIPLSIGQIFDLLGSQANADGTTKLTLVDWSADPKRPFTVWAALTGAFFVGVASFDQDLAQRFLVARSPSRGAISVIASQFVSVIVVSMFMFVGLLLFIFYQRPDVMGANGPVGYAVPGLNQAAYQQFLLMELPPVLSGLAIAGLFAVAQGSMDSAINAMAGSAVADLYLPWRQMRDGSGAAVAESQNVTAPTIAVAAIGGLMTLFAVFCAFIYDPDQKAFLDFALGMLNFAFSGMLAVFVTGLFTRRGNNASVIAALVVGFGVTLATQDFIMRPMTSWLLGEPRTLAFTYAMPIATILATAVCMCGRRKSPSPVVDVTAHPVAV
jgi:SSS family solute:Na+ symporter